MNACWNDEDVQVSSISTCSFEGQSLFVKGTGLRLYARNDEDTYGMRAFVWSAMVTPQGWNVVIYAGTGKVGEIQGTTFNLPLEVASIAKRLL